MAFRHNLYTLLVLGCFFISGTAGLVYEVLWVRMIDRIMGSSPHAVATVLVVFMGGLALGSFIFGRVIERFNRRHSLLALYGILELAIGLYALVLPYLISAIEPLYRLVYDSLYEHVFLYSLITFFGCLLLLLAPATLMGGTLPVLCRYYVRSNEHLGQRTGFLYGLNTTGAALGTMLCGFVLIPAFGIYLTLCFTAGVNIIAGSACLLASFVERAGEEKSVPVKKQVFENDFKNTSFSSSEVKLSLVIFAVSGFSSMACQVFWTRLIGLLIGPTHYSFTLVVAVFIVGIALGSIVFGYTADRVDKPFRILVLTQIGAAVSGLAVSQILGSGQFFFAKLIYSFQGGFAELLKVQSLALAAVLVIPTFFWGASFPLVLRIVTGNRKDMGRTIGTAYAVNTTGAITGSFAAGFIVVLVAGKQNGLSFVFLFQFSVAVLSVLISEFNKKRFVFKYALVPSVLLAGIMASIWLPSWDKTLLSRGWYRDFETLRPQLAGTPWTKALINGSEYIRSSREGIEVVFYGEGAGGFTTVEKETTSTGVVEYAMFNSGKADASSHGDRSTQTLSGHIPMLFHPAAENVMVLGLASGMTPGEVLHYPVQNLDILEINDQVVEACSKYFRDVNNGCLDDPRTRVIVQDGRNHLALTKKTYDVVISEPSNPWMAGLASLYTEDFFYLVKKRLTNEGVFAQWIQSYEMDWDTFALLGRTFTSVFPEGTMMKIGPVDYLLIGRADGRRLDWSVAEKNMVFAKKSSLADFRNMDFLAHLMVTEDLPGFFGEGHVHTDDLPHLEFSAPVHLRDGHLDIEEKAVGKRRLTAATAEIIERNRDADSMLDFMAFCASVNAPLFSVLDFRHLSPDQKDKYMGIVCDFCSRESVPSYSIFKDAEPKVLCASIQSERIAAHISKNRTRTVDHYNFALALIASGKNEKAEEELEKTLKSDPFHREALYTYGLLMAENNEWNKASMLLDRVTAVDPSWSDAHLFLGITRVKTGRFNEALSSFNRAVSLNRTNSAALNERGLLYMHLGMTEKALEDFRNAIALNPGDPEVLNNMARACVRAGDLVQAMAWLNEALRIYPDNEDMKFNLAQVSAKLGKGT